MSFFDRYLAGEPQRLTDETRSGLPGRFLHLTDGVTHVDASGPRAGRPLILLHGFSIPLFVWDPAVAALADAGLRVTRYDLFGRGFSDRPQLAYDHALFRRQLLDLLDHLHPNQKVSLLALSMGAVVAADFAVHHPDRIERIAFIDPAGFALKLPWLAKLSYAPLIGELLLGVFGRFGRLSLVQSVLTDFYRPTQAAIDAFLPRYLEQMAYQGFKRALLSTLRAGMLEEDLDLFAALAATRIPVQLIWGEEDRTVPFAHHRTFQRLVPHTEFHPIPAAGHIPYFERPELVLPLLIRFLAPE